MKGFSYAFAVLSAASFAAGHMEMVYPPPLQSRHNKFSTDINYDIKSPMKSDGSNFPCGGALKVLNSPQGKPVDEWNAGEEYSFKIAGQAYHSGGSCQASLSYDNGTTYKVIKSYEGNCPLSNGETSYKFEVPSDARDGDCIFSWSWFNKVGNREMYQNCAVVTIKAAQGRKKRGTAVSMSQRPDMFVANVGNGCSTTGGTDVEFPQPGPDVDRAQGAKLQGPSGEKCQKPAPGGDKPTAPSPSASSTPAPTSVKPTISSPSTPAPTSDKPTIPSPSTPSKPVPGGDKPTSTPSEPSPPSCTGGKFPDEQNKPAQPPSGNNTTSGVTKPTMSPAHPSGDETTSVSAPPVQPEPTSVPTPGGDNDVCTPGAFACAPNNSGWRVCDGIQGWVLAGACPQGTACQFDKSNNTPYCR
ncbi:hypothetical protein J3459_006060 [Metarhizium acridum]|nr:hypothetical protein J3459_006060 [Metarhizium acridum]